MSTSTDDSTVLARAMDGALVDLLTDAGWERDRFDRRLWRHADHGERWITWDLTDQEVVEPPPGTMVSAHDEGTLRRGAVDRRGPGYFSFGYDYASGRGGSRAIVMMDRTDWRVG